MFIKIKYYFTEFLFCFGIGNAKKKIRKLSLLLHDWEGSINVIGLNSYISIL